MKKILITAATGNQGSAAAYELLQNNFEVFALTRDPQSLKALQLLEAKLDQTINFVQVPLEILYQQSETFAKLVEMIDRKGYDPIDYKFISFWMPKLTGFEQWLDEAGIKKIRELQITNN